MASGVHGSVICGGGRQAAGVPGILVSDGRSVVRTDVDGCFSLPSADRGCPVFVSVPAGYRPIGDFFQHCDDGGMASFQLAAAPETAAADHAFVLLADYQWEPDDTMRDIFKRIITDPVGPQFMVHVGDLFYMMEGAPVHVARRYYEAYRDVLSEFNIPIYNLIGNHDQVNGPPISPTMPEFGDGLYKEVLGPTYYSFDWGEIHYVVLNPFTMVGKTQHSRVSDRQLRWLESDLACQPPNKPLILFTHRAPKQLENEDDLLYVIGGREVLACFVGDWHRDAIFRCPGEPFSTIVTVGPLENMLWLPAGYRVVEVQGHRVRHTYRLLHAADEVHIVRPAAASKVSVKVELIVTEHIRSDRKPAPAYSVDGHEWKALRPEVLPGNRTVGCDTKWARWQASLSVQNDTAFIIRAADDSARQNWVHLPLKAALSPVAWRQRVAQSGDILWRSQPVITGPLVVLGEDTGIRAFLATDGQVVWEHRERGRWLGTPLAVHDRIIVTSWEGDILALGRNDGNLLWRAKQACAIPPSQPCATEEGVIIGGMKRDGIWDGSVTCYDLQSGAVRWCDRYDHPYFATPLYADGCIWITCGDRVQCLDAFTGGAVWAYHPEHFSLYGRVVIAQGRLFAPDIDGWTYVLDPHTGAFQARYLLPRGTGLAADRTTLYAACGMRGLRAYDAMTLHELWCVHRPGTYFAGHPFLRSSDLIVAASDGNVYIVDKQSGKVTWSFQLGNIGGATVVVDGERAYLVNGDGELVAFACPVDAGRRGHKED